MEESVPSDNGNYSCIATNIYGSIQRDFTVEVRPRTVAQKPIIDKHYPGNFTVLEGSSVTMECPIINFDTFDPPEIAWLRVHPEFAGTLDWIKNASVNADLLQKCSPGGYCYNPETEEFDVDIENPFVYYLDNLTIANSTSYCCYASNFMGGDLVCGLVNVVTSLPDPQAEQKQMILLATVIPTCFLLAFLILSLTYACKEKSRRQKTDKYARSVVVWTKRVMISMDGTNGSAQVCSSPTTLEPRVTIQKHRVSPSKMSSTIAK